jgi:hypothetical protein
MGRGFSVFSALALGAGLVSVAPAQESAADGLMVSGDILASGQFVSWTGDSSYNPESGAGIDVYGRLMVPLTGGFSVQVDAALSSTPDLYTLDQLFFIGAHASWRDPQRFMVGIMGAVGHSSVDDFEDYPTFLLGAEGQIYLEDTTFFKQAGVTWAYEDTPGSEPLDLVFVRGGVRHFFDGGWTVQGDATFAAGTFDGADTTIFSWGVSVEKQLDTKVPIALFARYEGTHYETTGCYMMAETRLLGGVRVALGAPDAKTQDRYGANTDFPRYGAYPAIDGIEC